MKPLFPVRETISGVEEDELDADLSGEENHMVVLDAGHGGEEFTYGEYFSLQKQNRFSQLRS